VASLSHWLTAEHVEDQPAGGGARIDGVGEGKQGEARGEVAVDELAEVADAAGEAIELHDDKAGGLARFEEGERALEAGSAERLGGEAGVLEDVDELEVHRDGVGLELGALGIEADAFTGLLLGADANVSRDGGTSLLHGCPLEENQCIPFNPVVNAAKQMACYTETTVYVSGRWRKPAAPATIRTAPSAAFRRAITTRTRQLALAS
jgi:hypothetical protein